MSKTFDEMVTNISTDIQDTSAEMKSIIGRYLNNRYREVLRSTNWDVIDDDYTVSVVAGTDTYTLPTDFGKELYVIDQSNGNSLTKTTFNDLGRDYPVGLTESGSIDKYVIFRDSSNNIKIKLYKTPVGSTTISMPYKVKIRTDLTSTDIPVNDFADLIEIGAYADAWRYKRQFAKARQMEIRFTVELESYMWDAENQENDGHKFSAAWQDYDRDSL